ncbi:PAS domain-containing protein [Caballeronia sp. J97]|uniref:PAS domain-containing protein n=1 Tax=Caballeronia sp. J97 TaxID=2805429 RepID=UPI0039F0052E
MVYRRLVQSITDYAIYMLDPDGIVSNWNAGAQRAKGYTAREIVGKHFSCFYDPCDRDRGLPQHGLETARATGKFEAQGWRIRKDGTRFWAHVVIQPIYDDDGALFGLAKITRDCTEHGEHQSDDGRFHHRKADAQFVASDAFALYKPQLRSSTTFECRSGTRGDRLDVVAGLPSFQMRLFFVPPLRQAGAWHALPIRMRALL